MSDTILEVHNLKKYFKVPAGTLHAVDNVSFHIDKGETLGLVGESGCGRVNGRKGDPAPDSPYRWSGHLSGRGYTFL